MTRPRAQVGRRAAGRVPRLEGTLEFMQVLWALHHGLERSSKRMAEAVGVTGQQRLVVRMIGRFPGITAGGLARLLHLHPSTVTGLLKRLERRGMIARRADARDGRLVAFRLSPQGRRLDARRSGTVASLMTSVLASLPSPRVEAARDVVRALADRFIQWSMRNDEETSRRRRAVQRPLDRRR